MKVINLKNISTSILTKSLRYNYEYTPNLMLKHVSTMTIRAARRNFLDRAVLNVKKDVLPAEARKPHQKILSLKQAGKCPGVILPYNRTSGEEVDVVLPGKAMRKRMLKDKYPLEKMSVRVEGKDHLCVLRKVYLNDLQKFIQKCYFEEYVPGQPNKLTIPLMLKYLSQNNEFLAGHLTDLKVSFVKVLCYNYEYPTKFYIDAGYVTIQRPYKLADLANTFPPGLILDPSMNPNQNAFEVIYDPTKDRKDEEIEEQAPKKKEKKPQQGGGDAKGADGKAAQGKAGDSKAGKGKK